MFRTGDLGRVEQDGSLRLLGRRDRLVKIRGVRVELAEVELALLRHPQVREAAAVALGAGADRQLGAVACPSGPDSALAPAELRRWAAMVLPAAMVPNVLQVVGRLPRTITGKIDREAISRWLDLPAETRPAPTTLASTAPVTEDAVAALWAEVLGVSAEAASTGDFLELGGDSLAAGRVAALCRQRFAADLPVSAVFTSPTVAELTDEIRNAAGVSVRIAPRARPAPLQHAQTVMRTGAHGEL